MAEREVVLSNLERVGAKEDWESFLSDELRFTNFTNPVRRKEGKQASIEGIRRFYAMVKSLEIEGVLVDGNQVCAFTRYELQAPDGSAFESHIAELFEVSGGRITSLGIYFDSAPYPGPPSPGID